MKKISLILTTLTLAVAAQAQWPILVDDFSGDLSAYTATRILNNGNHSPVNTGSWAISGGALTYGTTGYVGIEQYALTRTDFTLGVGRELTADYTPVVGSQDIGLYVGAGTPTQDVRANYISLYMRTSAGQLFTRGFNGTTEFGQVGWINCTPDKLFIAHTSANVFDVGYYAAGVRRTIATRTITSGANVGSSIGFYADVRAAGTVGSLDNLSIPEPSTAALLGFGLLGAVLNYRRRK